MYRVNVKLALFTEPHLVGAISMKINLPGDGRSKVAIYSNKILFPSNM